VQDRTKVIVLVVVTVAMIATVILCCAAIRSAAGLFNLDPPRLY
jgi:hypothetical protein